MNWHETILQIRKDPAYQDLVRDAYFSEDLTANVVNFQNSPEFTETLKLINHYAPNAKSVLDIGAGNGISSISLAQNGFNVTVVEPDPSDTVGANAIRKLVKDLELGNVTVFEKLAEEINFPDESFDLVYVRQALHHAFNLEAFVKEASRVLKKGGVLITIRDHVIFDQVDKEYFFENHPLHKYYGGENAFTSTEYKRAFHKAGLTVLEELKYFDSPINYFPQPEDSVKNLKATLCQNLYSSYKAKFGILAKLPFLFSLYKFKNGFNHQNNLYYEKMIAGRMYSYILRK